MFCHRLLVKADLQHTTTIPEQTVAKACKGDLAARAELYRQYSKAMYNVCIRMTGNQDDAADVLQDAFVQAFDHLAQLKQPEAFAGWLKQIVVNQCIRFCKQHTAWSLLSDADANTLAEEETTWWTNVPLSLIHEQIKSLPAGCRQVFVLFALENFGHREIAESLGISESTSKSQYQRARKLLRERIAKQMEVYG